MPDTKLPARRPDAPDMDTIVARFRAADNLLMRSINQLGSGIEAATGRMGPAPRAAIETALRASLDTAFRASAATDTGRTGQARSWRESDSLHRAVATVTGALGGFFGTASSFAELPVAVTAILRSIRSVARDYGYDPDDPEIARECLIVFTAGSPDRSDDGVDTAFLSARLAVSGGSVQKLIATVSARLAGMLGQKLGAQTLPVLGAVGGATVNYAFMSFYTEMAHVYFGLKRLSEGRDREAVLAEFRAAVAGTRMGGP
ncbi:MAG: EcsC family protein [Rhodobacteraceae bacterium]|nr:EcsC family protein [Paracoccaceae bacterium]